MHLITIREKQQQDDNSFQAELSFDNGTPYPITITPPFSEQQEQNLAGYFEESLSLPFANEARFAKAAASIPSYGEDLFKHVFSKSHAQYRKAVQATELEIEIVGSPAFHQLHWETLKNPKQAQPLALHHPITRKPVGSPPPMITGQTSPTINILLVVARPNGQNELGYRTISQPLVETLHQAQLPVKIDILRPGTYHALVNHLETMTAQHGKGYYHVIHFDVPGALLTYDAVQQGYESGRFLSKTCDGRAALQPYEGKKAFLGLMGNNQNQADLLKARELAEQLLTPHGIPIVVLNACPSTKTVDTAQATSLLGNQLSQAGAQAVLTMAYAVNVSAAQLFIQTFYVKLFESQALATAARLARLALHNDKTRQAYFNQPIDLEDWLLPVVYQHHNVSLPLRAFTPDEEVAYRAQQAPHYEPPQTQYGFVGRDLDVLAIENRLLSHCNVLLIYGRGGAGKTTLLHHLGAWWQTTHFVDNVFYFGYDKQAWKRQHILAAIAQQLKATCPDLQRFESLSDTTQQKKVVKHLRTERHLLILDNLESITGSPLAIPNSLPSKEQQKLQNFLKKLVTGKTLVLLASQRDEAWLAKETFGDNRYPLSGLEAEAASQLADNILTYHNAGFYREEVPPASLFSKGRIKNPFSKRKTTLAKNAGSPLSPRTRGHFEDLQQLLLLLAGYPLALEVALANLAHQPPKDVLAALQTDDDSTDISPEKQTETILQCINYSHGHLSPTAQQLMWCLAPFSGMIDLYHLPQYTDELRQQPVLAKLLFKHWEAMLQEVKNAGFLIPHPDLPLFCHLQPIFPYFMRSRLYKEPQEVQQAIKIAFQKYYDGISEALLKLFNANKPEERQLGPTLVAWEYENLTQALDFALATQRSIQNIYWALSNSFEIIQDHQQGLALGESVLTRLGNYPTEAVSPAMTIELAKVMLNVGYRHLRLEQYQKAKQAYQGALKLVDQLTDIDDNSRSEITGTAYHQLGVIAQEQRQWQRAEQYCQKALQIRDDVNNRSEQATTYHQLGTIAKEQQQLQQAEQHYKQALAIKIEFDNRYEQAGGYHALGVMAEKQAQWKLAKEYFLTAFKIWAEFKDTDSITTYLIPSLARLYEATQDETLPTLVADISNTTAPEARKALRASANKQHFIYSAIANLMGFHPKKFAKAAHSVFGTEDIGKIIIKAFTFLAIVGGVLGLLVGYFSTGLLGSLMGLVSGGIGLPLLVLILEFTAGFIKSKQG